MAACQTCPGRRELTGRCFSRHCVGQSMVWAVFPQQRQCTCSTLREQAAYK